MPLPDSLYSDASKYTLKSIMDPTPIPPNVGDPFDPTTRTGSFVTSGIDEYKKDLESRSWGIISDMIGKYPELQNNREEVLKFFGGAVKLDLGKAGGVANDITNALGIGSVTGSQNGVVPIPPYMSQEDGQLMWWAASTLRDLAAAAAGGRPRPNYELIFRSLSSSDIVNSAVNWLTGDYLKKEFEKGRWPSAIPNSESGKTLALYSDELEALTKKFSGSIKDLFAGVASGELDGTDVWDVVKSKAADFGRDLLGIGDSSGIAPDKTLYNNRSLNQSDRVTSDYILSNDPYSGLETSVKSDDLLPTEYDGKDVSISQVISRLKSDGLLTGYHDIAGFEIGSNHRWIINLYPYPTDYEDFELYQRLGRSSVTPALPIYTLPNMWKKVKQYKSSIPNYDSGSVGGNLLNTLANNFSDKLVNRLIEISDSILSNDDPTSDAINDNVIKEVIVYGKAGTHGDPSNVDIPPTHMDSSTFFNFSRHTPVLSYDLTMGAIKTESLRLFNGAQSEIFMGMNYNPVLNMSILDDAYNSMYKYMINYINQVYDVETGSIAPYYNCAFQIELVILRSGGQINHSYKFIGVPIEFTPRLDGQSTPNECRVDVTFSIIGMKVGKHSNNRIYPNFLGGRSVCLDSKDSNRYHVRHDIGNLTWNDIQFKLK